MNHVAASKESRLGFVFLIALLVVAGASASIVGYKVKSADIERKQSLQVTYTAIGGKTNEPLIAAVPLNASPLSDREAVILAYETNQHIRGFGLVKMLQSVPKDRWPSIEEALGKVGADEAQAIVRESVKAYYSSKEVAPTDVNVPAEVSKTARLYNSKVSRYVEANLYKFTVEKHFSAAPHTS